MKKLKKLYYAKDARFACDCCGKEFEKLRYSIEGYSEPGHIFCCKRHLEKFVRDNSNKKYSKPKNW